MKGSSALRGIGPHRRVADGRACSKHPLLSCRGSERTERMGFHLAGRPIKHEQSLVVIIAADVEAANAAERVFTPLVRVTTESKRDSRLLFGEELFQSSIAGKGIPQ